MLFNSFTLYALTALAGLSAVSADHDHTDAHLMRKRASLAPGALTSSKGCTKYYTVKGSDYCSSVASKFGLSLSEFYKLNTKLNKSCSNLYTGKKYCVAKRSSSGKSNLVATSKRSKKSKSKKSKKSKTKTKTKTRSKTSSKTVSTGSRSLLSEAGVTQFLSTNTGIASWYHTDSSSDSTNGHSWCGFPYNDQVPGFAPSVETMLKNFNYDYEKAATAYCGLEAVVTTPDGKSTTLYIADGFASEWVRTPGSIDVIYGSFSKLFGKSTNNKNDVVQGTTWVLTGRRNNKYKFKGEGSG